MTSSRAVAEEHSAALLKKMQREGKFAEPLDDAAARELLKTPPAHGSRRAAANSAGGPGGETSGSDAPSAPDSPSNMRQLSSGPLVTSGSAFVAPAAKRVGTTNGGLPPSMAGATAAQALELLVEEAANFQHLQQTQIRFCRDHMQRSLLQLFEDTVRDKFASTGPLEGSIRPAGGNASVMGFSTASLNANASNYGGPAARALRALNASKASASNAPSLRPVDRSGQLGTLTRGRGADALTDFVVPDAVRQQLIVDINQTLDHELRTLETSIASEVNKVTTHVRRLADRMTTCEEELLHASVELDVSAQRLADASARADSLEAQVRELGEHCREKERQMDILREQVKRRNAALDHTRTEFRKEVMRYKARIYELEMEADGVIGRGRRAGAAGDPALPQLRARHIGNDAVPDEAFENPERLTAAVEDAERELQLRHDEEVRRLRVEFERERRAFKLQHNAAIAERDHEILELRRKLKMGTDAGAGGGGHAAHKANEAGRLAGSSPAAVGSEATPAAPTPVPTLL